MSAANPIAVSEEEPFVIGKSDLAYFFNNPCRCDCALVLLCTSGHAQVTVGPERFYGRSPRFTRADFSVRVKRFYGLPLRSSM